MNLTICNGLTNRTTIYTGAELRRDAQAAVKGLGKLVSWTVHVQEGNPVGAITCVVATYQDKAGFRGQRTCAI